MPSSQRGSTSFPALPDGRKLLISTKAEKLNSGGGGGGGGGGGVFCSARAVFPREFLRFFFDRTSTYTSSSSSSSIESSSWAFLPSLAPDRLFQASFLVLELLVSPAVFFMLDLRTTPLCPPDLVVLPSVDGVPALFLTEAPCFPPLA